MTDSNRSIALGIVGAGGRMGQALRSALRSQPKLELSALIERDPTLVADTPGGVLITADPAAAAQRCRVLVDFSVPAATLGALAACASQGCAMVIGTTGFSAGQKQTIADAAKHIPICLAANFSVGVNVALRLVELAARTLGTEYDVEVVEAHHRHKVDAPSGTALRLGEAAATGLGTTLEQAAVYVREGQVGARTPGSIGFATVRGGDVVGDHSVLFLGEGERVEIAHRATSRGNFAQGALRAAAWIADRAPGLYDMRDVLGLR